MEPLSDLEKRRQLRRQKILANQGSRLDRILGTSGASIKASELKDSSSSSLSSPEEEGGISLKGWNIVSGSGETMEETEEDGVTFIRKRNKDVQIDNLSTLGSASTSTSAAADQTAATISSSYAAKVGASKKNDDLSSSPSVGTQEEEEEIPSSSSVPLLSAMRKPRGFAEPLPDGSTLHPKLPFKFTRFCLCLLAIALSLFSDKYLFITFFSWELAVLGINGLPEKEAPSSVLLLLLALMGLKDQNLQRLKTLLKLGNCLVTDLSIFVVVVLMTRVFV